MQEHDNNAGVNGLVASSRLTYTDEVIGSDGVTVAEKTDTVHYAGWLENREGFGRSVDRGQPCSLHHGIWQVFKGWDESRQSRNACCKQKVTFPTDLGNGTREADRVISLHATVIFDVGLHGL